MVLAYRAKLYNCYPGCAPSEERVDDLGLVWFTPFTLEKAREAAQMMGYTLACGLHDELEESLDWGAVEIAPTLPGAESAWIEFSK